MRYLILSVLLFSATFAFTQVESDDVETTFNDVEIARNWQDQFYLGLITTYYIDFATSPVHFQQIQVGMQPDPNDPNSTIPKYENVPYQSLSISYFSFGVEPRLNLYENGNNFAVGVAVPVTIGIGQTQRANEFVNGVTGLGNIQIPVMAKLYLGSAATSRSDENFGFNIGAGYEMNKIALIPLSASEDEIDANKAWLMPSVSAGVNFYRGRSPMEVNIKYGAGRIQEITNNGAGGTIPNGSRKLRASSIKLSFVYLIN